MAYTWDYSDVISATAANYTKSLDQTTLEFAMNNAIKKMWLAYDWRGTVVKLPPFWLVPGEQDYGSPTYSIPSDFYGLRETYLVWVGSSPIPIRSYIPVVENLEKTSLQGAPGTICYRAAAQKFRVHPAPTLGMAAPNYLIDGTYKKRPCRWTRAALASRLLWDDEYFDIFVQAYVWAVLRLSGQTKAAMEQDVIFKQALYEGTQSENLELGEPSIHPGEALAINNNSYGGSWGVGGIY